MIAYKVVLREQNRLYSVMKYSIHHRCPELVTEYEIDKWVHAPSRKYFDRLYAFKNFTSAKHFWSVNNPHDKEIYKCEIKPLKSIYLFDWDIFEEMLKRKWRLKDINKYYMKNVKGTIPCKSIKLLEKIDV